MPCVTSFERDRQRCAVVDGRLCCIYDKYVATFDPKKSKLNQDKHGVVLESCKEALDGDMLTLEDVREDYGEQRFVSLGWAAGKVVVLGACRA